ncbi:MAG: response regulator [Anaeromyxobacter sp.]
MQQDVASREASEQEAWRASTADLALRVNLAVGATCMVVLTPLWVLVPQAGWAVLGGWALTALMAGATFARLRWQVRAGALLGGYFVAMLLAAASLRPSPIAFAFGVALVVLAGLLFGGRGALVAAGGVVAALAGFAVAGTLGARPPPSLPAPLDWLVALSATAVPLLTVVLAVRRLVEHLRAASEGALRALRQLESTRSRLADSERTELVGRVAGALAHDLNNTLTVVLSSAEWLEESATSAEQAHVASQVRDAARSATGLTQQLALVGRQGPPRPRALDLARAAADAGRAVRRLLPPGVEVEARAAGPVWTWADPSQLQHLIFSLALHAGEAMTKGGSLGITAHPGPDGAPVLDVSHTGGDAEVLRRAFAPNPFESVSSGPVRSVLQVRELAQALGGAVALRSFAGAGAVLSVTLPAAQPPAGSPAPPAASHHRARVLVVEDDIRVRALICTALADAGHKVDEASDGTSAMRAIEDLGDLDLLVTDLLMPGVPVVDVIATFRARHPEGRVLVCSSHADDEAVRRRVLEGEYRALPKPFDRAEFLEAVAATLDGGRAAPAAPATGHHASP